MLGAVGGVVVSPARLGIFVAGHAGEKSRSKCATDVAQSRLEDSRWRSGQ